MSRTTTAETPLTLKQQKFAVAVAEGKSKTQAHEDSYETKFDVRQARARVASELAKRPNVAAEIKRLTWLTFPPLDDVRGMREQAVRIISDLSRDPGAPHETRLKAALSLYKIAETARAASDPRASDSEQDKLLDSLRKLYARVGKTEAQEVDIDIGPAPPAYDDEPIDIQAIAISDTKLPE